MSVPRDIDMRFQCLLSLHAAGNESQRDQSQDTGD
jgi:hypothetical protein